MILAPTGSEGALGIDDDWNAVYSGFGRTSMFVLTKVGGDRYRIRTAELRPGGEPLCLQLAGKRVSATSCDASAKRQLFTLTRTGATAKPPRYAIMTARKSLVQQPSGAVRRDLRPRGSGPVRPRVEEINRDRGTSPLGLGSGRIHVLGAPTRRGGT